MKLAVKEIGNEVDKANGSRCYAIKDENGAVDAQMFINDECSVQCRRVGQPAFYGKGSVTHRTEIAAAVAQYEKNIEIAQAIQKFLEERNMWDGEDARIYYNGKALCAREGVIENISPLDYFDYANLETVTVAFDGCSLYEALNYGTYGWGTHDELVKLLEGFGYYFELGNAWNLTLYKIDR